MQDVSQKPAIGLDLPAVVFTRKGGQEASANKCPP